VKYLLFMLLLVCYGAHLSVCKAQPSCEVLRNDEGTEKQNGSRLCIGLKITGGKIDIDRSRSRFSRTSEFTHRLTITPAEAEELVFDALDQLLRTIDKPYRFALSEEAKSRDNRGELSDPLSNQIRTANKSWSEYLEQFQEWTEQTHQERSRDEVFSTFESDAFNVLVKSHESNALPVWEDGSFDPERGTFSFVVMDPISSCAPEKNQVRISFPDLPDSPKKDSRHQRIVQLCNSLAGRPRCLQCLKRKLETFYAGLGLDASIIFDAQNASPLLISIIESKRIVSASWISLDPSDVDKLLYSLLTEHAFRLYLKNRSEILRDQIFNYRKITGQPGPYLNAQRMQIQQLLVSQLGYVVSLTLATGENASPSNFNLAIQKLSGDDQDRPADSSPQTNETPDAAPATTNKEGVVTGHQQEKESQTDFTPKSKPQKQETPKDKKRYIGGGVEYFPGQGPRFFGLGQLSRFPLLPESVNNLSAKGGGQGTDGALGSVNYFSDYVFFNQLHRRVSLQLTVASDLEPDRVLGSTVADERRRTGVGRVEFEAFRDLSGSLLRFFVEGRHETVALDPRLQPTTKANLTTLEIGSLYFFESIQVEKPRRIRFEPKVKFGLGLAAGEPRYNKFLITGNFHQVLGSKFELDLSGRFELVSAEAPPFELASFGGAEVVRGFRKDDGLGRRVWSLQNELWIPLPIGNELSTGFTALLRERVKGAAFADVGGVFDSLTVKPGNRIGTGIGLRIIYNPVIFKIDYGYGFGDRVTGGARGKFYFGVGTNLPF